VTAVSVHQVVGSATPDDAATADALELREAFRRVGPSDVYAGAVDPALADEVLPLADLQPVDVVVLHVPVGDRLVVGRASTAARHLVLRGHLDLAAIGAVEPDWGTANHLRTQVTGPVLLAVGDLVPDNRPDLVIRAYHVLVTYLMPEANLIMVGAQPDEHDRQTLQGMVRELNLAKAWLAGPTGEAQRAAFWRRADALVAAGDAVRFDAALVEAMVLGVPVIATDAGLTSETVGPAGLLLPNDDDCALLAEAMFEVLGNDGLRARLAGAGRVQAQQFDARLPAAAFAARLLETP